MTTSSKLFKAAYPFADDVLVLPVTDINVATGVYANAFGLREVKRIGRRVGGAGGVRIGFVVNGGGALNDGAALL